jgi:hypothetical protein
MRKTGCVRVRDRNCVRTHCERAKKRVRARVPRGALDSTISRVWF